MSTLLSVPGLQKTSAWFRWRLVQIGRELNIDPDYIANVISGESGFDPAATNPHSGATGLIQFMPSTAERLGTTTGELRAMSAEGQLDFVRAFYRPFAGRIRSAGDAAMATFLPAFVGKPGYFVLGERGSSDFLPGTRLSKGKVYEQNEGLDTNGDGVLTVGEVTAAAERRYAAATRNTRTEVPDEEPPRPKVEGVCHGS